MKWDDCRSAQRVAHLDVTPTLSHPDEAGLSERSNRFRSGEDRKLRAHAAISTDAMIGGSLTSGAGASSK